MRQILPRVLEKKFIGKANLKGVVRKEKEAAILPPLIKKKIKTRYSQVLGPIYHY